ncbi:TRAP-type C4-dicarboxylate transport system substrate-binding protein [Sulfitobacter undariae]|uniref:TRAP-type C4-dicarboxylate transport system substrate-binding protein n=1 Tax=Sulfitobacter undariae TaxID=1563671 RepID=A0A7W6E5K2_9RHOB|nr:C4-dicarboxylate TRAP transporter substrate-binding protein [Sulfitobacter undariae]MBB3995168.1 TRAP-type C4-dicarboxylate transport system substrate-binding protein [Sulfitobacter undariae]
MTAFNKKVLAVAIAASCIAGTAIAKERLNYAYGYPITSNVGKAFEIYSAAVTERSKGEIVMTGYPMTLLSTPEASAGVRDGLADVAFVLPPYHPADYPTNLFLHELNSLINLVEEPTGKEPLAYSGAVLEYTFTKCPECLDEYKTQNQVFTAGTSTPVYGLLCKDVKITSLDDFKNKRMRVGSAGYVRFAEAFGAQAIRLPVGEAYEAMDQGVIDCAMLSMPELTNYNLYEVVTDITLGVPGGLFAGNALANVNRDRWLAMDDAGREAMIWGGSTLTANGTWISFVDHEAALENARAQGIKIHQADPEFVAAVQAFVKEDVASVATLFKETYNVARAEEIAADFPPLLEKWNALIKDVESAEELNQIYWDQVMSKVDPATYGQ